MKIKSVELRKFRRFSNLQITDIPQTAKLVVLVGTNGTGKSSIFDAFSIWKVYLKTGGLNFFKSYHSMTQFIALMNLSYTCTLHCKLVYWRNLIN